MENPINPDAMERIAALPDFPRTSYQCTNCGDCKTAPCERADCGIPATSTQAPLGCMCGNPGATGVMHRSEGACQVTYASAPEDIGSANVRRLRAMLYRLSTSEGAEYGEVEREIITHIATIAGTPSPVPAQPALTVWEGVMPESNGKSNFTAILHRKDAKGFDIYDGYTIAQSEYPDRVRYEADCVRHLIGELSEQPEFWNYDADKHSGYTPKE